MLFPTKNSKELCSNDFQILERYDNEIHVKWVPCHHGMARPQVADGGDGLQIWRVA
jgi:hypothetical protein